MPVSSEKEEKLAAELKRLGIREEDLEETFIRGSGAGGQKINKTSSCVRLQHLPSGLEVRCQDSRSQSLNRYHARQRLVELMLEKKEGEKSKRQQKAEKIRRQKRRRSRRSKEKMLKEKNGRLQRNSYGAHRGWKIESLTDCHELTAINRLRVRE